METRTETSAKLATLPEVCAFCLAEGLQAEVVGSWVWVKFDAKPSEETREKLKAAGFRWIHKRGEWAHNCGQACRFNPRIGHPRQKYQTQSVSDVREDRE